MIVVQTFLSSRSVSVPTGPPLRIAHLGKYYPPSTGGIETHTRALARTLADLGVDVQVVAVNHAAADGEDVTFDSLRQTPSTHTADGPVQVLRAGRWANLARLDMAPAAVGIIRQMLKDPPDIWHLHAPNVTMMLAVAAFPKVRPLVITHHSDIVRQRFLKYGVMPLERLIYNRAAAVLATSPRYAAGSSRLQSVADKVTSVPLGLDLAPFRDPSEKALAHADRVRPKDGSPLWLAVGRISWYKGLEVAIKALRHVPGQLAIVGAGPQEDSCKKLAETLGVADRVVWYGRVAEDELVGWYRAATALWFPSVARSEGFGLVQVEAMASGCPVLNTDIPGSGVPWVCPHEEAGLTVPVGDDEALAAAARRLLTEPGLRDKLAAGGRARAAAEFDQVVMAKRTLAVYRAVIRAGVVERAMATDRKRR
jgi:glycosyltransferase involved in cell wall biosynthesis